MKQNMHFFRVATLFVILLLSSKQSFSQTPQQIQDHKRKWDTPAWTDTLKNPYKGSQAAIDTGKKLYAKICSVCHGDKGKGDGIAAGGLPVHPADHTSALVQSQSDGSLFYELSNGHAPMPAYKTVLTEKQRWSLVCYIKTLKPKTTPTTSKSTK